MLDAKFVAGAGGRLFLALIAAALTFGTASASNQNDATAQGAGVDQTTALVQLNGDPLATYEKTKPTRGKKIDFNGSTLKAYRAQLAALRNDFKQWLRANARRAKVTGEFDISLNAVAVQLNGEALGK